MCGDEVFAIEVSHYFPWGLSPGKGCPRVTHTGLQLPALHTCWPKQVFTCVRPSLGGLGLEFRSFSFLTTTHRQREWRQADSVSLPVSESLGCHSPDCQQSQAIGPSRLRSSCPFPILKISQISPIHSLAHRISKAGRFL